MMMDEDGFSQLENEADALASDIKTYGELPKIGRSIKQVMESTQALWSRIAATSGTPDLQANLLLANKGFDLPQMAQKLHSLGSQKAAEAIGAVPLTDIKSFLQNERESAIMQLIDTTYEGTNEAVYKLHMTKIFEEWRFQKTNLMNSLLGSSKLIVDIPNKEESILHETLFSTQSTVDQEEVAYEKCLKEYNNAKLSGRLRPNLLDIFADAARQFNNQKLNEMWKMLKMITQIQIICQEDIITARGSRTVEEDMRNQALLYLEERYKSYMSNVVNSNRLIAKRGGLPGTFSLVKAFVGVRVNLNECSNEICVEGIPIWPIIYYCLRCDDTAAAIQVLQSSNCMNSEIQELITILEDLRESPNRRLTMQKEMLAKKTYRGIICTSNDRYKKAVYSILSGNSIQDDHKDIIPTMDDYLWLNLFQVKEESTDENTVSEIITYKYLQQLVVEQYGEEHFNAIEQPHIYFQTLVLTGQWESALDFLLRVDKYKIHAIHMAIALNEMNLLALPTSVNMPLLVIDEADSIPMRRLNLFRSVVLYVRKFELDNPKDYISKAIDYFYCLRHLDTNDGLNGFVTSIINLALEKKYFSEIFGTMGDDGVRKSGLLDPFEGTRMNVKETIEKVGIALEQKGLIEEAVSIYDLCGNSEKVLTLLNKLLGNVVAKKPVDIHSNSATNETSELRTRLLGFVTKISNRYERMDMQIKLSTIETFNLLKNLAVFFDFYRLKKYPNAIDLLVTLDIIPTNLKDVGQKVKKFRNLDENVIKNIPNVLLAAMNIYYDQYKLLKIDNTRTDDYKKSTKLEYIRERVRAITDFTGNIPYRMPGDTTSRLVQLEMMMS